MRLFCYYLFSSFLGTLMAWAAKQPVQMYSLKHRFETLFRMKLHMYCIYWQDLGGNPALLRSDHAVVAVPSSIIEPNCSAMLSKYNS